MLRPGLWPYRLKNFWRRFTGVEKKLLLLFVLTLLASSLVLIAQKPPNQILLPKIGGSYTEGLLGGPLHINPLLASANEIDQDLSRIIYSGLLKFDENLNLVPDLAENLPEISADGKNYTIKLKKELYWHDGVGLTSDDLVFTYRLIQEQAYQSPLRLSWNRVEVEKLDTYTVKLTTRESSATFIANLTVGIIPKHIWETVPSKSFALSKFNLEPIGAGPYRMQEIKRSKNGEIKALKLAPHPRYHGGSPYLKNLTFKFYLTTQDLLDAYHSKEVQGLGFIPFDENLFLEPKGGLRQILLPLPQYQAVFINRTKNPAPLEDLRVRLALAKAVDKQKILEKVYGGKSLSAQGPILEGHLGYHEQIPGADMNIYDIERAKNLLAEAGWHLDEALGFRKDKLGRIMTLGLATNNFPPNVRVAENLKELWQAIGIQIVLNIESIADLEEKFIRPRNYELLLLSENVGADPDPYPFWHSSGLRDPGVNLSTFSNKTADKLLVEARANIKAEERAAKYRKFQEIFVGDVPAIFIARSVYIYNLPKHIQGIKLNTITTAADRFANLHQWYIETKRVRK